MGLSSTPWRSCELSCCFLSRSVLLWMYSLVANQERSYLFSPFLPASFVFVIVFQVVYPTFIQPLFNKLTPLPEGELRTRVEALASKLGFPLKHLYVIDGSKRSGHSNAYFYGLPWSKHIVSLKRSHFSSPPPRGPSRSVTNLSLYYRRSSTIPSSNNPPLARSRQSLRTNSVTGSTPIRPSFSSSANSTYSSRSLSSRSSSTTHPCSPRLVSQMTSLTANSRS